MHREDFPFLFNNITYLDNGATTLKPLSVVKKIEEYYYSSYIPQHYKITLGYFLFAYYAGGMRISDVLSFRI